MTVARCGDSSRETPAIPLASIDEELLRHLGFSKEVGVVEQLNPLELPERHCRSRTLLALQRGQG